MNNISITENGALGYYSTQKSLLDLHFMVSSFRNEYEEDIVKEYVKAFYEDKKYAIKWLFFLRDIQEGLGERRTFRICLKYLAISQPDLALAILPLISEYGRYDDLLVYLDTPLCRQTVCYIQKQLKKDMLSMQKQEPISLLAKWLPSNNTSSRESRRLASLLTRKMGMTDREYRKTLSSLRAYLDITEVKLSSCQFQEIAYSKVPAKANLKYSQTFERHDYNRRCEYLESLINNPDKLNSKGLFPYEIVHSYQKDAPGFYTPQLKNNLFLELMWKKMLQDGYQNPWGFTDCIVVADGSASMYTPVSAQTSVTALEVCNSLAIYFAEQLSGIFHNKAITFSSRPQFINLDTGNSLKEKLEIMLAHNECSNTNIEAVFDLLLSMAINNHVPKEELPRQVLIISDMEFDDCAENNERNSFSTILFDTISKKYQSAGYTMPRLIFWNVCSRTHTIPMIDNKEGLCLLSGFSQNAMKTAVQKERKDPYVSLLQTLDSPRYQKVEDAIINILPGAKAS